MGSRVGDYQEEGGGVGEENTRLGLQHPPASPWFTRAICEIKKAPGECRQSPREHSSLAATATDQCQQYQQEAVSGTGETPGFHRQPSWFCRGQLTTSKSCKTHYPGIGPRRHSHLSNTHPNLSAGPSSLSDPTPRKRPPRALCALRPQPPNLEPHPPSLRPFPLHRIRREMRPQA